MDFKLKVISRALVTVVLLIYSETAFLCYLSQALVLGLIYSAVVRSVFYLFTDHTPNYIKGSVKNLK